ncbi:MAG: helix-turn-helix domain-containing protein, partial [Chloroflexi bacterium]|nr:helix-turn-helix domain-containing protein [Chloroflexota bacterium]
YYEEGMTQGAITEVLGIRDQYRVKKWVKAYRREGLAAFDRMQNRVSLNKNRKFIR